MQFTIELDYTPQCPQPNQPFTETSFTRQSTPFTLNITDIGIALVDLWNFGWEDGPVSKTLGPELSLEHGLSHARRKRQITERVILPTVAQLRNLGVQIFHCNHSLFPQRYPEWLASTTEEERAEAEAERLRLREQAQSKQSDTPADKDPNAWPPKTWVTQWREQHTELIYGSQQWMITQGEDVYPNIDIPAPVRPAPGDLLIHSGEHFHRWLQQKQIRVLFYMGFETTACVMSSSYGIINMQRYSYLCNIVRDCTTTIETAETVDGLWCTRGAFLTIEEKWGYSVDAQTLVQAVSKAA